jgi:hypothetical protein
VLSDQDDVNIYIVAYRAKSNIIMGREMTCAHTALPLGSLKRCMQIVTYLLTSFFLHLTVSWLLLHFDNFTDGRTPWTSDQPVARPLPKHRTT